MDTNSAFDRTAAQQETVSILEMIQQSNMKLEYPEKTLRVLRAWAGEAGLHESDLDGPETRAL